MPAELHPGQFRVGSPASRAAARMLIEDRRFESELWDTVLVSEECQEPRFGEWKSQTPDSFIRSSIIPAKVTFDQALHGSCVAPVAQYSKYTLILVPDRIRTIASEQNLKPEF